MLLAELLPQSNVAEVFMDRIMINDEEKNSQSTIVDEKSCSFTSIKIPLVSFEPILATSEKYILVNEFTKRRNQLILYDDQMQKSVIRSYMQGNILDALWYDKQKHFLIMTSTNIFTFDPVNQKIELINDLIPINNQTFKCFTLLNPTTLLIAYNQWAAEHLDQWQQNEDGLWTLIKRQSLALTFNEFIGNIITVKEDDYTNLAITIYNLLTEQWRVELRHAETLICHKAILLPGSNLAHDYRIMLINNAPSNIKWLVFSSGNSDIIAIDFQWKKVKLNYKHPVQRMALFNENYLILRTTERVDIHLFL